MKSIRQYGFNAGEWDRRLAIRSDMDKYHYACQELVNFDADCYGTLTRRRAASYANKLAGAIYVPDGYGTDTASNQRRMATTVMNFDDKKYLVVIYATTYTSSSGRLLCQIFDSSAVGSADEEEIVLDESNSIVIDYGPLSRAVGPKKIPLSETIDQFRFCQSQDELFCVHPYLAPFRIVRTLAPNSSTFFRFSKNAFEFKCKPLSSEEESQYEIEFVWSSDSEVVGRACYSGVIMFKKEDGSYYIPSDLGTIALETDVAETISGTWNYDNGELKTSEAMVGQGKVTLGTGGGRWAGELAIQVSYDKGKTWSTLTSVVAPDDGSLNPSTSTSIDDYGALVRVALLRRKQAWYYESADDGTGRPLDYGCKWWLKVEGARTFVFTLGAASGNGLSATCQYPCPREIKTTFFRREAWRDGLYPRCVEIAQERIWFMGTDASPKTVWASEAGDISNFLVGTTATSALAFAPSASVYDRPMWMRWGNGAFMIGGTMSEMSLSGASGGAITATNVTMNNQTVWGSANVDSVRAGNRIFYVKSGGRQLQAMQYSYTSDSYESVCVNTMQMGMFDASEMGRITKLAYSRNPIDSLFVLTEKGRVARLVFSEEQNVYAWSRYEFSGNVLSIEIVQGDSGDTLLLIFEDRNILKIPLSGNNYGKDYGDAAAFESRLTAMPMDVQGGHVHGARSVISGVNIYGSGIGDFEVSTDGGATWDAQFSGFTETGENVYRSGEVEVEWSGDYADTAQLSLRTRSESAFTLYGYGAEVRVSG